jgi:hypothetical protein
VNRTLSFAGLSCVHQPHPFVVVSVAKKRPFFGCEQDGVGAGGDDDDDEEHATIASMSKALRMRRKLASAAHVGK